MSESASNLRLGRFVEPPVANRPNDAESNRTRQNLHIFLYTKAEKDIFTNYINSLFYDAPDLKKRVQQLWAGSRVILFLPLNLPIIPLPGAGPS
jgi:hypothetical protein